MRDQPRLPRPNVGVYGMLGNAARFAHSLALLSLGLSAVLACGEDGAPAGELERQEASSTPHASSMITKRVRIAEAYWGGIDMTIDDLVRMGARASEREAIIVGRVASVDVNLNTSIIAHQPPGEETPPPSHPKSQPLITPNPNDPASGIPFSHFTVIIERVIHAPGFA